MKYFVMLRHPNGFPLPIVDDNENTILYDSRKEANEAGNSTSLGEVYGFEVYKY